MSSTESRERDGVARFLYAIDSFNTVIGKAAAWLIIGLMLIVCVEVLKRYYFNAPTAWIYDLSNVFYGSLFMLAGAYTLAQNGHVRGDFLYSSMRPRTQATLDLILYFLFFFPGILALCYAGFYYAQAGWRINELPTVGSGFPIWPFKSVIPIAGALVALQGMAEVVRCIHCLKTGEWPERLKDVAEADVIEQQLSGSEHVDSKERDEAIANAARIDEAARQRGRGGE